MTTPDTCPIIKVSADIRDLIRHAHPQLRRKLRDALRMVIEDPNCGKALKGELEGLRSFRVGKIRLIYALADQQVIEIVAIGPRKTIYEETYRLIKRSTL